MGHALTDFLKNPVIIENLIIGITFPLVMAIINIKVFF